MQVRDHLPSGRRLGPLNVRAAVVLAAAMTGAVGGGVSARADVFRDIAVGLGYAGFNIEGQRNVLSNGVDLLVNTQFSGTPLDFGIGDLTLNGPISLDVRAGRRFLPTLDISLTTALSRDLAASPLAYSLSADVGNQTTDISGTLLIDADLSINSLGFYDLNLTYSSRQTVERDGRFAAGTDTNDSDVGPITVSGNIFADLLAMVTDPLFGQSGRPNPFASFSGNAQLKELFRTSADAAVVELASAAPGQSPALTFLGPTLRPVGSPPRHGSAPPDPSRGPANSVVPEPAVLVLMLLAAPAIVFYRRRSDLR
ncbi:MAG: PEP-CTERM sorting domain-containing protein [Planctomycetes bacterium]|nr:PEP-CTERM sorting domain-containing protein [Planctomycetota bacterium]